MALRQREFICICVDVDGSQYSREAMRAVEWRYPGRDVLSSLPEGATIRETIEIPATGYLPTWNYMFYVEAGGLTRT